MPCSSVILSKTCGPPTKASFGPTEALVDAKAGAAWDVSTSAGAISAEICLVSSFKMGTDCFVAAKRRDLEHSFEEWAYINSLEDVFWNRHVLKKKVIKH